MHKKNIIAYIFYINLFVGLTMIPSVIMAAVNNEHCFSAMLISFFTTVIPCAILSFLFRSKTDQMFVKDGWMIATFAWLFAGFFGALPFLLSNTFGPLSLESFINCYFESISGFTTTGSSVLGATVPIESLDHSLLLWRSLTHWLGGLGILVLIVMVLPIHTNASSILFRSETSQTSDKKIRPRTSQVARTIWLIYLGITALGTIFLMIGGLSIFDAFCNAVGAVATGGYSTRDASIAGFHSLYIEVVIMILMLMGSISFSLHYGAITRGLSNYWKSSQFKWYCLFMFCGMFLIVVILFANGTYESVADSLRYGSFQTISIMSTTGFSTAAFENWPYAAQFLLLIFMFIGGMVGSTSGAIKTSRVMILIKYMHRETRGIIHPKIFAAIKSDDKVIHKDDIEKILAFVFLYIMIFVVASTMVIATGIDIISSIGAVAATLGGVGPGLGTLGAFSNYYEIPMTAKCILMTCMILGRLEIFTVIALFTPAFWKK